jgi:hypothetical protein
MLLSGERVRVQQGDGNRGEQYLYRIECLKEEEEDLAQGVKEEENRVYEEEVERRLNICW